MAKILDVPTSGSIHHKCHSHNRGGQYIRNRVPPTQPVGTGRRGAVKTAFGAASSAWASLTGAVQAAWNGFASAHPVTDSLGQSVVLTGHQMYVSVNSQLLNCGQAQSATIPASAAVFSAGTPTFTAVHAGAITLTPTGLGTASDFLLVAFSPLQSGGVGSCKTFWQERKVAGNSVVAIVATATYNAQFGSPVVGQRIFYRVTPVNQYGITGVPAIGFASAT